MRVPFQIKKTAANTTISRRSLLIWHQPIVTSTPNERPIVGSAHGLPNRTAGTFARDAVCKSAHRHPDRDEARIALVVHDLDWSG